MAETTDWSEGVHVVLIQFGITTKIIAVNKVIAKLSRNKQESGVEIG